MGSNQIRAILADRAGALWVSTVGSGLTRYANGRFSIVGTNNGLAGDRVVAIHEDEEGALLFATRRGLSRLKDGAFFTWTSQSGLFTDLVYAVVDDGHGNFWFSSAVGLFKVSKEELRKVAAGTLKKVTSVAYGEKDGMKTKAGNLGNQPVAWRTTGGQLLFTRFTTPHSPIRLTRKYASATSWRASTRTGSTRLAGTSPTTPT